MAASHGTQRRYVEGCRCEDCREAHRVSARAYRERRSNGESGPAPVVVIPSAVVSAGRGPVESGVEAEISGLASEARPGLAQAALALARILDNPKAVNQQPSAAKVLGALLENLRSASARGRRGNLAVVRTMTTKGGRQWLTAIATWLRCGSLYCAPPAASAQPWKRLASRPKVSSARALKTSVRQSVMTWPRSARKPRTRSQASARASRHVLQGWLRQRQGHVGRSQIRRSRASR